MLWISVAKKSPFSTKSTQYACPGETELIIVGQESDTEIWKPQSDQHKLDFYCGESSMVWVRGFITKHNCMLIYSLFFRKQAVIRTQRNTVASVCICRFFFVMFQLSVQIGTWSQAFLCCWLVVKPIQGKTHDKTLILIDQCLER